MLETSNLVEITPQHYGVSINMVYASPNNITGQVIYQSQHCLLHPAAAVSLKRAAGLAQLAGLQLGVLDAYRPPQAQQKLWAACPDSRYVADVTQGSHHSRGVAVDVQLQDEQGQPLDMGSEFDDMSERSHPYYPHLPVACHRNRLLLIAVMTQAGFVPIKTEWWHYELPMAKDYPIIHDGRLNC